MASSPPTARLLDAVADSPVLVVSLALKFADGISNFIILPTAAVIFDSALADARLSAVYGDVCAAWTAHIPVPPVVQAPLVLSVVRK